MVGRQWHMILVLVRAFVAAVLGDESAYPALASESVRLSIEGQQ